MQVTQVIFLPWVDGKSPHAVWPGHSLSSVFSGVLEFIQPDLDTVKVRVQ